VPSTFQQNMNRNEHPLGNLWSIFGIRQHPPQDGNGFFDGAFVLREGEMTMSGFVRRQNDDATTDLICLGCFQTVAHSPEQGDLVAAESAHACNPFDVERFQSRSQPEMDG
jgi:hypothetical protein